MKQMMRMLLVLALVMCLLLCGALAEETVSGATAKLHYMAGGFWPSTDGNTAASTTVQITGEGTYTLSVYFPDQGGWAATGSGIESLYLIVDDADVEGSVMDGMYIGVSDVRVNGTSVAIGTAAFGPTGYVKESVFTEEDGFSVLYDRWMLENSNVPLGHETWDGSEGTLAVVNPDDFVDVTQIDVDFFVTDTQGEKPEEEKETGVLTIPAFTIPSQTYKTLAETGVPVADILAGIPDIKPVFSGNTVSIADIGDAVKDVYFYGMNMAELSLADGVWSAELTEDMTEAEMYGMVQFSLTNGSLNYASSGWTQYTQRQNGTELCLDLYPNGGAVLSYGDRTVARFSNTYDAEGALTRHQVRIGQSYTEYNGDGSLFRMILVDENWNETVYFGGVGWCMDYWGEEPCDAPAGYEDVDLAWIYTNFPHEIPGGIVVEPTPVLALPEINFPQATYNTLEETGLDLDAIIAVIPTELDISYADGVLKVKDVGASIVTYTCSSPWSFGEMTLADGYWTAKVAEYTGIDYNFNVHMADDNYGWSITYYIGENPGISCQIDGAGSDTVYLSTFKDVWWTAATEYTVGDCLVYDSYSITDGNLQWQSVSTRNPEIYVQYIANGKLEYFWVSDAAGTYTYFPATGWDNELPEEYAHITEEYVRTNLPCQIPGTACTEHDWKVSEAGITPTCSKDGREDLLECQRCGETSGGDVIPALGHDLVVTPGFAPTCIEKGREDLLECQRCGETSGGEAIPALVHDMIVVAGYEATCVESGLEDWLYCERCGLMENLIEIPPLGHDLVITPGIEPTCTEDGMTDIVECLRCVLPDDENGGDVLPPLGHDMILVSAIEPTCTETGMTEELHCDRCGLVEKEGNEIPALGHVASSVICPVPPTCTEIGTTEGLFCDRCGTVLVMSIAIPPLGHDMTFVAGKEPTCTTSGWYGFEYCRRCLLGTASSLDPEMMVCIDGEFMVEFDADGDVIIPDAVSVDPYWHMYEAGPDADFLTDESPCVLVIAATVPTCTKSGRDEGGRYCELCQTVIRKPVEFPALGHSMMFMEGYEPTCTEDGMLDSMRCQNCGMPEDPEAIIPALGHDEITVPGYHSICIDPGYTDMVYCQRCGLTLKEREDIPALGHALVVTPGIAPTCTEEGMTDRVECLRCVLPDDEDGSDVIPALGHDLILISSIAPTCTENGMEESLYCNRCGLVQAGGSVIPALGHDMVFMEGYEPTCTQNGLMDSICCQRCGQPEEEGSVIAALGHDVIVVEGYEATCTKNGMTQSSYCQRCGLVIENGSVIAAMGHDPVKDYSVLPTCTKDGLSAAVYCGRCGLLLQESEVIPALGHKMEIVSTGMMPSCDYTGISDTWMCQRCGDISGAEAIAPLGHDMTFVSGREATCTTGGWYGFEYCQRCLMGTVSSVDPGMMVSDEETFYVEFEKDGDIIIPDAVFVAPYWHMYEAGPDADFLTDESPCVTVMDGVAPTCTQTGLEEGGLYCELCQTVILAPEVIYALGHDLVVTPGFAPTCTEDGRTDSLECLRCVLPDEEDGGDVIPALGHSWAYVEAVAPTCTEDGHTEGYICPACNATKNVEVIPATGHPCTYVSGPVLEGTVDTMVSMKFDMTECWAKGDCDFFAYQVDVLAWNEEMIFFGSPAVHQNLMFQFVNWQLLKVGASQLTVSLPMFQIDPVTVDVIAHSAKPAVLPAGTVTIEDEAFMGTAVEEYVLPEGVEVIGSRAFADNDNLKLINIPDSVTEISADAFEGCDNLTIICSPDQEASLEALGVPCVVK